MDTRRFFLVPLLAAALVLFPAVVTPVAAQQESALDVTLKISRIDQLLNRIDAIAAEARPAGEQPPSLMLRAMLNGTDWIDPERPVVIGIEMTAGQFAAAALVPFTRPNDNFAVSFNAMPAPDHYVIALPPGQPLGLSDAALTSLVFASGVRPDSSIAVEVAAKQLLQKAGPMLQSKIDQVEVPAQRTAGGPDISSDDIRNVFDGLLDIGRQTESFSLGLDLYAEQFRFVAETRSVPGTEMAALFSSGAQTARLGDLAADHHIRIKSRAYDLAGAVDLFSGLFGSLYQKLGINFGELADIAKHFTGETVGGVSYGPEGVQFEMIAVLDDEAAKTDFVGQVYLPWVEAYSRQIAAMYTELLGTRVPKVYQRTGGTTVGGVRVVGGRYQQPVPTGDAGGGPMSMITTEIRIAQIDEMVLFAPDDARMASLIKAARAMTPGPEQGPHIRVQIDLAAYFRGLLAMLPELEGPRIELPDSASVDTGVTFDGGRAVARTTFNTAGFADFIAAAQAAKEAGPAMAAAGGTRMSVRSEMDEMPSIASPPPLPPEKDPDHWFERGSLAATYGAHKWAIKFFEKAISLDPERSDAWFQMGIAYGEIRWFDKAVEAVNKAIELKPDSGLYYYGRGRIYLILGAEGNAVADFQRAAEMGNRDARNWLRMNRSGNAS